LIVLTQFKRGKMKKLKFAAAFAVVAAALLYLVLSGLDGDKVYYLEVSELLEKKETEHKGLRVAGFVTENLSVDRMQKIAQFEITDDKGAFLECEYFGAIPDAFEEGASVVVEGSYDLSRNIFTANKLLAKCPSKYEVEVKEPTESDNI
jgi:cytochrome c-type biogenesis protein CcmE